MSLIENPQFPVLPVFPLFHHLAQLLLGLLFHHFLLKFHLLLHHLLFHCSHFGHEDISFANSSFFNPLIFGTNFSLTSGLVSMLIPISGRDGTTVYHLWFLPCLFLAEIAVYWIVRVYIKNKAVGIWIASAGILFGLLLYTLIGKASVISALPLAVGFMLVGVCLKSRLQTPNRYLTIVSALLFACFTVCNYQFGAKSVDLSSMSLGIWQLFFLCGLTGGIFIICLAQIIKKSKVLASIGSYSLYYYGLHYEVLGVANRIRGGIIAALLTIVTLYLAFYLFDKIKRERLNIS